MVTISQLESWQPDKLSTIADDLNTHRSKLVDLQDEITDGKPPSSWVGIDSYSAETKHTELAEQLVDSVAEIGTVISALDTASTDIGAAKDSLMSALASAQAAGFKVDKESGTVSDPTTYDDELAAQHAGVRVTALAEQLGTALDDAATADAELAGALRKANSGSIDVDGDLGSLGLDAQLRGMSPEEQAAYLLDHPDRGREILDALPPAVKKEIGSQLSELTDDIMDPNKDIDEDFLENLNELQDAYGEDPMISTSFLDTMGPSKLVELNGWIANLQQDDDFPEDFTSYDNMMDHGLAEQMGNLQTNLGQILGAGTAGLDGDGEAGTDTHVSSDWVQQLVATGDDEVPFGYQGPDGEYTQKMYGYQLMAPMLHSADSGYLLNEVGDGMLKFETDFAKDNGGALPWSFPIIDEDGVVRGGRTDGVDQTAEWDGARLDWTQGTAEDDQAGFDPMGGLLDGLSRNPDAARDFFTGDDVPVGFRDGDDTTWRDESRVDYLLTDREWGPDHTNWSQVNMAEAQGPSNEEYLGDALKSATMDDPTDGPSREQVRDILEETVHSIGSDEQVSGHDNLDLGDDKTTSFSETDWVRPGLRDDIADILGHHSETLHQTFESGSGEPVGPYDVSWDDKELTRVLADLGKDPSSNETLRQAEYAEAIHQMKSGMEGYDQPGLVAENDGRAMAKVMSALDYGAVRSEIEESTTADEEHNSSVTGKADLARGIVDLIPTGKNPLVGAATDAGLGSLISGWEEANQVDHIGDRNYSTGELLTARRDMTEDLVREVIRDYSTDEEVITNAANDAGDAYAGEYGWAQNIIEGER